MKRKQIAILGAILLVSMSCRKEEVPQIANFSLDFTLAQSGSMTKASDNPFDVIYDDLIQTRKITPTHYNISFTLEGKSEPALVTEGYWNKKEFFALPVGTYKVVGRSEGLSPQRADTLCLSFNQTIKIEASTNKIALKADYASCMLIFDAGDIGDIYVTNSLYSNKVFVSNEYKNYRYCCFDVTDPIWSEGDVWNSNRLPRHIHIIRKDETVSQIFVISSNFENGKYYYYKDIGGEYELAKMNAGS